MNHECPRCGSPKATTVMLPPGRGTHEARPHPAFRCMVCDTQWADEEQWARIHSEAAAGRAVEAGAEPTAGTAGTPGPGPGSDS